MSSANQVREPRKPRVFKTFDIDELSIVDVPAQQPALLAIRKDKDGEQLSDRIKDPDLDPEEKRKLAAKLNPNYGKSGLAALRRIARAIRENPGKFGLATGATGAYLILDPESEIDEAYRDIQHDLTRRQLVDELAGDGVYVYDKSAFATVGRAVGSIGKPVLDWHRRRWPEMDDEFKSAFQRARTAHLGPRGERQYHMLNPLEAPTSAGFIALGGMKQAARNMRVDRKFRARERARWSKDRGWPTHRLDRRRQVRNLSSDAWKLVREAGPGTPAWTAQRNKLRLRMKELSARGTEDLAGIGAEFPEIFKSEDGPAWVAPATAAATAGVGAALAGAGWGALGGVATKL